MGALLRSVAPFMARARRVSAGIAAAFAGLLAAAIATLPLAATGADADTESAIEALKRGSPQEARALLEQSVKRAPSDYTAALSYALALPPKEALKKADSLSRIQSAPAWARARSLQLLGDNHFFREDYKSAAEAYRQASTLDNASVYKLLHGLSMAMAGQAELARGIWTVVAGDTAGAMSAEAARLLALLPKPPEPKVSEPKAEAQIPAPAVAPVNQQAKPAVSTVPTVSTPSTPAVSIPPPTPTQAVPIPAPAVSTPAPTPTGPVFTVQVGAFSSKENADNLVKRLTGKYNDITISTTVSGDQTLFRVRVGSFPKREDAVAYADDLIIEAGLSARVVER